MVIPVGSSFFTQTLMLVQKDAARPRAHAADPAGALRAADRRALSAARWLAARRATATRRLAIALVSAAALAYQLLLMRWLAIAHWHPFAVMIISLALLGHGASGTWLSLWLRGAPGAAGDASTAVFAGCALLFALSARAGAADRRARFRSTAWNWCGIRASCCG